MKNIKRIRLEHNLTQIYLQMQTGIEQSLLSKYETGARIPPSEHLMILADIYHTSLDFLMDRTDEVQPYPEKRR